MRTLTGLLRFTHLLQSISHTTTGISDSNGMISMTCNILSWFPWGFLRKEALYVPALFSRSISPLSSPPHLLEVVAPAAGKHLVFPREMQAIPCIYMCISPAWKFLISLTSTVACLLLLFIPSERHSAQAVTLSSFAPG